MNYRNNRNGEPLSVLGYGCMRFTKNGSSIDIDKAEREVARAVELGVNYFDTAYISWQRGRCRRDIQAPGMQERYKYSDKAAAVPYKIERRARQIFQ